MVDLCESASKFSMRDTFYLGHLLTDLVVILALNSVKKYRPRPSENGTEIELSV